MLLLFPKKRKKKRKKKRIKCMEKKSTKDEVSRTPTNLVLGSTYQVLIVSEGNIGRRHSVALLVGYYFHTIMLPHCHVWVRYPEIDIDCRTLFFTSHSYFWYEYCTHFVSIVTERDVDAEKKLKSFFFFDRNGLWQVVE